MVFGAGLCLGTEAIHRWMVRVFISEALVMEAIGMAVPDRSWEGERFKSDRLRHSWEGGQLEVLPKIEWTAGGVEGICEDRLSVGCGT